MANQAFARVGIDQLLKDAGRRLTDGRALPRGRPLGCDGEADCTLFNRQGCSAGGSEAKSSSVHLTAAKPWRLCATGQFCRAEWRT